MTLILMSLAMLHGHTQFYLSFIWSLYTHSHTFQLFVAMAMPHIVYHCVIAIDFRYLFTLRHDITPLLWLPLMASISYCYDVIIATILLRASLRHIELKKRFAR